MRKIYFLSLGVLVLLVCVYLSGIGYYIHMTIIRPDIIYIMKQQINRTGFKENFERFKNIIFYGSKSEDSTDNEITEIYPGINVNLTSSIINNSSNETYYITAHNMRDGRLGNQMFRYASLIGIARAQQRRLIISSGTELEDTFVLNHVMNIDGSNGWPAVFEVNAYSFDEKLMNLSLENVRIGGFLQTFTYFKFHIDEVIKEFKFKQSIVEEASGVLFKLNLTLREHMLIGVHVRRGDFLLSHNIGYGYASPEKSYFLKAFDWMKTKFPGRKIIFLVASDDINWCKENFVDNNVITLPGASGAVHMAILSSCDHVIMSGGTFGWWSAFLSRGQVIYYNQFMRKGTTFGDQFTPEIYYPPWWHGFGN